MKKKILFFVIIGLILIPPVVALAADITIDNAVYAYTDMSLIDSGIYWTSNTTGYVVYISYSGPDLKIRKTTNGGLTWGSATTITMGTLHCSTVAAWADWETPGSLGTKIHIIEVDYPDAGGDQLYYCYYDTYDDSVSSEILVESLIDSTALASFSQHCISITKTQEGVLAIAYRTGGGGGYEYGFETSIDGGNTWTLKSSPWEATSDLLKIYPANSETPDDIQGIFWDRSDNEISLKTYDYTADSWSEQSISTGMYDDAGSQYLQMDTAIRYYDEHLILAAWDEFDSASANLTVWDIYDSTDITQLTDVTENASETFQTAVFINQSTNEIYVSYLKGGTIETNTMDVVYQKSMDEGLTWGGEVSFSDSSEDYRSLYTANIKPELGGKFMPSFFNATSIMDLFTNYIHSISISAYEYSGYPAIAPDYVIDCPTCTDNLTSSGNFTSNETFTGGPPGFSIIDAAAAESGGPPIWLWGWVGMFTIMVPGFFITYMERKHGAGNGTMILRIGISLIVLGLLVTWGRFDWWMVILYGMMAVAIAAMSRQYDFGGAGGISQHGWIGFCGMSWIGLTIINRILEGQFLTTSESSWWCSIQLFNEFKVFDLFSMPVLNFQFFTVGIPSLLRWDYSFFGGNAEIIQYLLYTITAVAAFILFVIMIGLLFNAFRAR